MNKQIRTVFAVCIGLFAAAPGFAELAAPLTPEGASGSITSLKASGLTSQASPPQTLHAAAKEVGKIVRDQNARNAFGIACEVDFLVKELPQDAVEITLITPCRRGDVVEATHAGLTFDFKTSDTGSTTFYLPKLAVTGELETKFPDDMRVSVNLTQERSLSFDRVAVEWKDATTARVVFGEARANNRVIHRLGDGTGRVVDVVSRPITNRGFVKVDRLVIMSQVTAQNCETDRYGRVRRVLHNQPPVAYDLSIAAPGCARIGTSMVLKNILQDLILAED